MVQIYDLIQFLWSSLQWDSHSPIRTATHAFIMYNITSEQIGDNVGGQVSLTASNYTKMVKL